MAHNNTVQDGSPSGDSPNSHEIVDDSVSVNTYSADWNREEYTDRKTGHRRVRITKMQ